MQNLPTAVFCNIAKPCNMWLLPPPILNFSVPKSYNNPTSSENRVYYQRYLKLKDPLLVCSSQESVDLGEIMFSLCYLPTAGRLTLTVIKCRNLKAMDITGYSGVFVCVYSPG